MAYREVGMVQVREILRRWLAGDGFRSIARALGVDRKTVVEYVRLAQAAGPDLRARLEKLLLVPEGQRRSELTVPSDRFTWRSASTSGQGPSRRR